MLMMQPKGFEVQSDVPMACKLKKVLYNLKQAPKMLF